MIEVISNTATNGTPRDKSVKLNIVWQDMCDVPYNLLIITPTKRG